MYMQEVLNVEKSIELLSKGLKGVKKACYDNLFDNLGALTALQRSGYKVEAVICFMEIQDNLFTRHACFTLDGEIIDTTYASVYLDYNDPSQVRETPKYILIKRYTLDNYLEAIENEQVTSLDRTLFTRTMEMTKQLMAKGIFVL